MKLTGQALERALARWPAELRAAVVFGPDAALVAERASRIGRQVVADLKDPFAVVDLTPADIADDPARLADEAAAFSLMGGRRLVRVAQAGNAQSAAVATALEGPPTENLILITAGDLEPKAKLRQLAESDARIGAIACYPEDQETLARLLRSEVQAQGLVVTEAAMARLVAAVGGEREVARRELDKLALYAHGRAGAVTEEDVVAIGADYGAAGLDALVDAVTLRRPEAARDQLALLLAEGESGIRLVQWVARRFLQVADAHAARAAGQSLDQILQNLFGRMAWKQGPLLKQALPLWSPAALVRARALLLEAEQAARLSGADGDLVCAQALLRLAAAGQKPDRGAARRRHSSSSASSDS